MATETRSLPTAGSRLRRLAWKPSQEQIILLVTLGLLVVFSVVLPGFATAANLLNLVRSVSILGILGLGMGLIVISRGIDLSEVAIMGGSWIVTLMELNAGMSMPAALLLGLAVALTAGLANGLLVAFVEAPALFVTLATTFVVFGLSLWYVGVLIAYVPPDAQGLLFLGGGRLLGIPVPILVFVAAAILVHLFLSRTSLGRFIYAQGDNPEAARLTGIAVRPLIVLEYLIVATLAWLAGLVWIGSTGSMSMVVSQSTQIFDVILVVVLGGISLVGGRGSVFSVVVGCALIGTLVNGFTIMDVNTEVQNIIRGVVLLFAILLDNRLHPRDEETARQGD
ncbi:MAG TPA: ABC transporter permease [Stellaceae bacterium]|nr:ABC transporter permease [Stellaceae bacterium]